MTEREEREGGGERESRLRRWWTDNKKRVMPAVDDFPMKGDGGRGGRMCQDQSIVHAGLLLSSPLPRRSPSYFSFSSPPSLPLSFTLSLSLFLGDFVLLVLRILFLDRNRRFPNSYFSATALAAHAERRVEVEASRARFPAE